MPPNMMHFYPSHGSGNVQLYISPTAVSISHNTVHLIHAVHTLRKSITTIWYPLYITTCFHYCLMPNTWIVPIRSETKASSSSNLLFTLSSPPPHTPTMCNFSQKFSFTVLYSCCMRTYATHVGHFIGVWIVQYMFCLVMKDFYLM